MSGCVQKPEKMAFLAITLITDEFCHKKPYTFKITSETEQIHFKIASGEKKKFILPANEFFFIEELGTKEPGVSTNYSQQKGLLIKEYKDIYIRKNYNKSNDKINISGQIYWEFDNECQTLIPDVISVYVINEKGNVIEEQKVSKDLKERWSYEFSLPKYDSNGKLNNYMLKSETLDNFHTITMGDNIKNIAYKPLAVLIKVCLTSSYDIQEIVSFKLIAEDNAPLPKRDTIEIFGQGVKSFMPIKMNRPGVYRYHICTLNNDLKTSQNNNYVDVEISVVASDLELELESINYIKCGRFYDKDCARFNK